MMKTTGPEQHDCADCGKPIGNNPRVTTVDRKIICVPCLRLRRLRAATVEDSGDSTWDISD